MSMIAVEKSSMLSAYAYDDNSWILSLQFKSNGSRIHYANVPPEVADEFATAESMGKFYSANIKGKYDTVPDSVMQGPPLEAVPLKEQLKASVAEPDFSAEMDRDIASLETEWATKLDAQKAEANPVQNGTARAALPGETAKWGGMAVIPTGYRGPDQPNSVTGEMPFVAAHPAKHSREEVAALVEAGSVNTKRAEEMLREVAPPTEPEILSPEQATAVLAPKNAKADQLTAELHRLAATAIQVNDPASQSAAEQFIVKLSQGRKVLFDTIDPYRAIAYAAYEAVQKLNKGRLDPIDNALTAAKRQVAVYLDAVRAKAREEQQRQYRLAQEAAEQERRKQTEALRLQVASEQAEAGDHEQAEASLFDEAIQAPPTPVYVPQVTMPTSSLGGRKNWKAELMDFEALILDVAEGIKSWKANGKLNGHAPVNALTANMTVLNQMAKAQEEMLSIPGVIAKNDAVISSRQKGK